MWHVVAGPTAAFVKLSPTGIDYEREVLGYACAARILADHEAPRLLATNPALKAIMSSPLPGKVVRDLPLEKGVELHVHVHEDAGRLLRRWHDQSDPATEQDRQDLRKAMLEQAQEAAACPESTAGQEGRSNAQDLWISSSGGCAKGVPSRVSDRQVTE